MSKWRSRNDTGLHTFCGEGFSPGNTKSEESAFDRYRSRKSSKGLPVKGTLRRIPLDRAKSAIRWRGS